MSHEPSVGQVSISRPGPGAPNLQAGRNIEEGLKSDKTYRRYAAGIDKALASFEPSQQEWADYIAFLGRLLRAIQGVKETEIIPHAALVSLRLAQCLNPSLPSGVHQKAIDVYANLFALLGSSRLNRDLQVFLPGLLPVLSFASLTVRPLLYDLYEEHILKLDRDALRPALKSIILGLLPGIEDETSEDFERGVQILDRLQRLDGVGEAEASSVPTSGDGYFWQCFFLAVITSENRRQGALAFLTRRLPNFGPLARDSLADRNSVHNDPQLADLAAETHSIVRPEPGLLIRCFAAGLCDANILVQRGFLDLLVTNLPLRSVLLQEIVQRSDLDLLVESAVSVALRRDMSLNRRLWSWFLGPEATSADAEEMDLKTPGSDLGESNSSKQAAYFRRYGATSLQRCLLAMLRRELGSPSDRAKPYRVCSALMDRWEIGGHLVPSILIPALTAVFDYHTANPRTASDEVLKSASLFFDGIESSLIWANLITELLTAIDVCQTEPAMTVKSLQFLHFVINKFNIREEDMLVTHIPRAILVAIHGFSALIIRCMPSMQVQHLLLELIASLVAVIPGHAFTAPSLGAHELSVSAEQCDQAVEWIRKTSSDLDYAAPTPVSASLPPKTSAMLLYILSTTFMQCIDAKALHTSAGQVADVLTALMRKMQDHQGLRSQALIESMIASFVTIASDWATDDQHFLLAAANISLWTVMSEQEKSIVQDDDMSERRLETLAADYLWLCLSSSAPKHHVEAVRLLWRLHQLSGEVHEGLDIGSFASEHMLRGSNQLADFERFATLWEHSVQHQPMRTERKASVLVRRTSSYAQTLEVSSIEAERLLHGPLLILLDSLCIAESELAAFSVAWLKNLPSLDRVLSSLLGQLESLFTSFKDRSKHDNNSLRRQRTAHESLEAVRSSANRTANILQSGSSFTWKVLAEIRSHDDDEMKQTLTGVEYLARYCVDVLGAIDSGAFDGLQRQLLRLLDLLLSSEAGLDLQTLHVEDQLVVVLRDLIRLDKASLQTDYLGTLSKALRIREVPAEHTLQTNGRPSDGMSSHINGNRQNIDETDRKPPPGLFDCIKEAISSSSSRQILEHWMSLLSGVLPVYSQVMFSAMIPLVECFCHQINAVFADLRLMSTTPTSPNRQTPISSLPWLLHGLELVLASAHSGLDATPPDLPAAKPSPSAQTFFSGNVMSSVGNSSKTARSNSRLTVILCVHDAVEICFNMWAWASYRSEAEEADPTSAATTAFNALKLRNRTKKILEHLFSAEGLECTEKMALMYIRAMDGAQTDYDASNVFSLLNVLGAARPRNTVPLILNALYSRTNMEALDVGRRSTLTCDLAALDVVDFLLRYVSSIEDDALDEIWTDCITFLRDVLSNPLPHRQILPALLEFIALLAEKINNTNFGELQQMHRALADLFSRLLSATFTVRPTTGSFENGSSSGKSRARSGDLTSSLIVVTPRLQAILESPDRILAAVNNMTTYAISPNFHAKSFPENIKPEILQLLPLISTQAPDARLWKREVNDAYSDSRIFATKSSLMTEYWFPVLRKWSMTEKTLISDILARIVAPSTAALMFGVGANSARLAADRTAQHNLRRTALLLLANDHDALLSSINIIDTKLGELCTATSSSSPSCATRAEVFMLWRALFLSTSGIHLAPLWPTINATLQAALLSALADGPEQGTYNNLSLLQACKLLDLLATLQPDDFQLHEWVYITNTIDAVYAGTSGSSALVDEVAEALSSVAGEAIDKVPDQGLLDDKVAGDRRRRPMLAMMKLDAADAKAMARDDFVRGVLMPWFSGLSMRCYEETYGMGQVDLEMCRRDLVGDLMDEGTVV
ncbi:Protein dopey [Sphaceloma murrayae]|uniref:Protein dopey n=1 Tax=Sphaceloma murrayae TaxID=2082308 RepID=A0A2K1R291_9PEZI|nr:Protein dopey [Sphaceloma murrayae]